MSKRVLSLVLAFAMVLGSFSFVAADHLSDIDGHDNEEAILRLEKLEVLEGYPDDSFRPDESITRAETATVLVRVNGLQNAADQSHGEETGYTDVSNWNWAAGYVSVASSMGIVEGRGDNIFDPNADVKVEEIAAMTVRALGYGQVARDRGVYPIGELIVADQLGILENITETNGQAATRASVAQIIDNALEIPMMVKITVGSEEVWIPSDSENYWGEEAYLIDEMGFETTIGRVTDFDEDDNEIEIDHDEDLEVYEGFDYYEAYGLEIKTWSKDGEVIVSSVQEEADFTAVEMEDLEEEDEDDFFEATVDGEDVDVEDFEADYAKVLGDSDEVIFAQGYSLDGFIVVEDVDDAVVESYDYADEDFDDYLVVQDGKTIDINNVEEGDIIFFNDSEDFAVVYNDSDIGEIDRVYKDGFRLDGDRLDLADNAVYLDDEEMDLIVDENDNLDALEFMMEEEVEVEVFFNHAGEVVLVVGEAGVPKTSSYYGVLTHALEYDARTGEVLAFDVLNAEEDLDKVENYDITDEDFEAVFEEMDIEFGDIDFEDLEGEVFEIEINTETQAIRKAELLDEGIEGAEEFDLDDTYATVENGQEVDYRLQDETVIFYDVEDEVAEEAVKLADADFTAIKEGSTIYEENGRVVAIVGETDQADVDKLTGLVTNVEELSSDNGYELVIEVEGEEETYTTEEDVDFEEGDLVTFVLLEDNEIEDVELANVNNEVFESYSRDTFDVEGDKTYELTENAVVYRETEEISLRDIEEGEDIQVFTDGNSRRFVNYVLVGELEDTGGDEGVATDGTVTYISDDYVIVNNQEIDIIGSAAEFFENEAIVVGDEIAFELTDSNKMFKITAVDGDLTLYADHGYSAISDLVVNGDLVIRSTGEINATNVTVKGDLTVGTGYNTSLAALNFEVDGETVINTTGDVSFNSELKGDVTVTSGNVTFTNVTIEGNLNVDSSATVTFIETVNVAGTITGAEVINTDDADDATKELVEDEVEAEVKAEIEAAAHGDVIDDYRLTVEEPEDISKQWVSTWINIPAGLSVEDLDSLEISLEDEDNRLVTNVLNSTGFEDHAEEIRISTSFIRGTEGNTEYAWDRGSYNGDEPTKVVVELGYAGETFTFELELNFSDEWPADNGEEEEEVN